MSEAVTEIHQPSSTIIEPGNKELVISTQSEEILLSQPFEYRTIPSAIPVRFDSYRSQSRFRSAVLTRTLSELNISAQERQRRARKRYEALIEDMFLRNRSRKNSAMNVKDV